MPFSTTLTHQYAADLGFTQVGIIPAAPSPRLDAYRQWIAAEMHGPMGYLARPDRVIRREDLNVILPGVRSLVIVALDYDALTGIDARLLDDPRRGRISNYAWGTDYHAILTPRLEQLAAWLREQSGQDIASRVYVDTGAILERSHAQQAGLGFIGKNTMLIHPRRGSFCFLGELLTTLEFDAYDPPHRETMCGTCTRCLSACPTGAFPRPYVLDARRCISMLTIELKGSIPADLRPLMGNWVYGCDVCQIVCPFTRFVKTSSPAVPPSPALPPQGGQGEERELKPLPLYYGGGVWGGGEADRAAPLLDDLLRLDEAGFRERFAGSAIERIGRERLVRNACVAARNSRLTEFAPLLDHLARMDDSALVREHAAWGWHSLQGPYQGISDPV